MVKRLISEDIDVSNELDTENIEAEGDKDIDSISEKVNKDINRIDLYWQLYRSALTYVPMSVRFFKNYNEQYDRFVSAVKNYYYEVDEWARDMNSITIFVDITNLINRTVRELDGKLPDSIFTNLKYATDKIISFIKSNYAGDRIL